MTYVTFFSSHCSQSSLLKLLEMPPSTTPCQSQCQLGINLVLFVTYVEEHGRGDMNTCQAIRLLVHQL